VSRGYGDAEFREQLLGLVFVDVHRESALPESRAHKHSVRRLANPSLGRQLTPMIDREALEDICREAGRMALRQWPGAGHALESWEKVPRQPGVHRRSRSRRLPAPRARAAAARGGWLSEETADHPERLASDLIWIVDPIDGTRDFIHGRAGWAVSVALVSAGKPLVGLLVAAAREEEWVAVAGQGAWLNGRRLAASTRAELAGARVPARSLPAEDSDLVTVERPNSIALRIAMVADGRADLLATLRWGFEWDIAAATLIAREAGAAVSDVFGHTLSFNKRDPRAFGLLVSAPAIHAAAVLRLADRAGALRGQSLTKEAGPLRNRPPCAAAQTVWISAGAALASSWLIGVMRISTRRFKARPSAVALSARGYCSP
jgi:myo-inositol-1(or 4)-monophosphatase